MKVLFVCTGNACRSPFAEALLRKIRPDLEADSAGLQVMIPISRQTRRYLAELNAAGYLKEAPQSISEKRLREYDLIVVMEQKHETAVLKLCPDCRGRTVRWDIEDPYFLNDEDAKRIYKRIEDKVIQLAQSA